MGILEDWNSRLEALQAVGWRAMSAEDAATAWQCFGEVIGRPAREGFRTPRPSISWDMSAFYIQPKKEQTRLEEDLRVKVLAALQKCTKPGEELLALDYNHTCFYFAPHGGLSDGCLQSWGMDVLPAGEEYNFIAQDYRFGIIGNTVSHTLCVFGQDLLEALHRDPPRILTTPACTLEEQTELERSWADKGWRILSADDAIGMWERFDERFQFSGRTSAGMLPAIIEPSPSITWSLSHSLAAPGGKVRRDADELSLRVLAALKAVAQPDERLYALDARYQPRLRTFLPERLDSVAPDCWPLPIWSDNKFSILIEPNFRFGLFGNPAECTLCVFGTELVAAVKLKLPFMVSQVIRQTVGPTWDSEL